MTKQESVQWFIYELSLDIDSGLVRIKELAEAAEPNEKLKLVEMYLGSAQAALREYCTGYGLRYSDEEGFQFAGDGTLRAKEFGA